MQSEGIDFAICDIFRDRLAVSTLCLLEAHFESPATSSKNAMNPMQTPGAVSWTELMTSDLDGAVEFYRAVFGWQIDVAPMSAGPYGVGQVDAK